MDLSGPGIDIKSKERKKEECRIFRVLTLNQKKERKKNVEFSDNIPTNLGFLFVHASPSSP